MNDKIKAFGDLHVPGNPLILYNCAFVRKIAAADQYIVRRRGAGHKGIGRVGVARISHGHAPWAKAMEDLGNAAKTAMATLN